MILKRVIKRWALTKKGDSIVSRYEYTINKSLKVLSFEEMTEEWIENYKLDRSNFDITDVDKELVDRIPTPLDMGAVYQRLISDTLDEEEDYVDGIIRVYNSEICDTIDNYNCSAFYEPSYVIARAYQQGGF